LYVFDGLLILVTLKVTGVGTQSKKKIHTLSDHIMTFGMFWPLIFLPGSTGCAVALDITLSITGN
jgi:hypothetical protein